MPSIHGFSESWKHAAYVTIEELYGSTYANFKEWAYETKIESSVATLHEVLQ